MWHHCGNAYPSVGKFQNRGGSSCFIPLTSLSFQDFEESLASRHLLQYLSPQGKQRGQNWSKSFRQLKSFRLQKLKKTIEITCGRIHILYQRKWKGFCTCFLIAIPFFNTEWMIQEKSSLDCILQEFSLAVCKYLCVFLLLFWFYVRVAFAFLSVLYIQPTCSDFPFPPVSVLKSYHNGCCAY